MGNGHPVAALLTSRAIAERFVRLEGVFFSTFGGNPVSVAAAHAVLDVLADERVLQRTAAAGAALRSAAAAVCAGCPRVGDVRGIGLMNAIEMVADRESKRPDAAFASAVRDGLRARGVLVGTTGPHCNILKARPHLSHRTGSCGCHRTAAIVRLPSDGRTSTVNERRSRERNGLGEGASLDEVSLGPRGFEPRSVVRDSSAVATSLVW